MTAADHKKLRALILRHEGYRLYPYMDAAGKITIGVGRNLSDRGLTDSEVDYLFDNDLLDAINDCHGIAGFVDLDPVRQAVLIDMMFNLGLPKLLKFKRFLRLLGEGDYARAATAMRNSLWAVQVKTRADTLIEMMRTGQFPKEVS